MPDNRWSTLAKIVPNLDDEDEQNGTGASRSPARPPVCRTTMCCHAAWVYTNVCMCDPVTKRGLMGASS